MATSVFKGQIPFRAIGQTTCIHHRGRQLDLYCEECQELACIKCIYSVHRKHLVRDLSEITLPKKEGIANFIDKTENVDLVQINQYITSTDTQRKDNVGIFKKLSNQLKTQTNYLKEELDLLTAKTLSLYQQMEEDNTKLLQTYKQDLEIYSTQLKQQVKKCKMTLQRGSDIQVYDAGCEIQRSVTFPVKPILGTASFSPNRNPHVHLEQALGEVNISGQCRSQALLGYDRSIESSAGQGPSATKQKAEPKGTTSSTQISSEPKATTSSTEQGSEQKETSSSEQRLEQQGTSSSPEQGSEQQETTSSTEQGSEQQETSSTKQRPEQQETSSSTEQEAEQKGTSSSPKKKSEQKGTIPSTLQRSESKGTSFSSQQTSEPKRRTPLTQQRSEQKGRTSSTKPKPELKATTSSSQQRTELKGRTSSTKPKPELKATIPSSQQRSEQKGRTSSTKPKPKLKASTSSSQQRTEPKGTTSSTKQTSEQKGRTPSTKLRPEPKGRTPSTQMKSESKGWTSSSQQGSEPNGKKPSTQEISKARKEVFSQVYTMFSQTNVLEELNGLCNISFICPTTDGQVWTSDYYSDTLNLIDRKGKVIQEVSHSTLIIGISLAPTTNTLWICDCQNNITELVSGRLVHRFSTIETPLCICVTASNHVIVGMVKQISQFTTEGELVLTTSAAGIGKPLVYTPYRVSECPVTHNVAVADKDSKCDGGKGKRRVVVMDTDFKELFVYDGEITNTNQPAAKPGGKQFIP